MLAADLRDVVDTEQGDFASIDEVNERSIRDDRGRSYVFEEFLFAELSASIDQITEFCYCAINFAVRDSALDFRGCSVRRGRFGRFHV